MSQFYLGMYWPEKQMTLREHADATRDFFILLKKTHQVFNTLYWVGNSAKSAIALATDLHNLDDIIFANSAGKTGDWDILSAAGDPTWQSKFSQGLRMWYNTGKSAEMGGITISLFTGRALKGAPSSVVIRFPDFKRYPDVEKILSQDFFRNVFFRLVTYWRPEFAVVSSYEIADVFEQPGLHVGWLTYINRERAAKLNHDKLTAGLIIDGLADGGLTFSLGEKLISNENSLQIDYARQLQMKFISEEVLDF